MKKEKLVLKLRAQRPCFTYESDDVVVTVYTKRAKVMRLSEVNWWLDGAKQELMRKGEL